MEGEVPPRYRIFVLVELLSHTRNTSKRDTLKSQRKEIKKGRRVNRTLTLVECRKSGININKILAYEGKRLKKCESTKRQNQKKEIDVHFNINISIQKDSRNESTMRQNQKKEIDVHFNINISIQYTIILNSKIIRQKWNEVTTVIKIIYV